MLEIWHATPHVNDIFTYSILRVASGFCIAGLGALAMGLQETSVLVLSIQHELGFRSGRELIHTSTRIGIAAATEVGYSLRRLLVSMA